MKEKKKNFKKKFDLNVLNELVNDDTSCVHLHKTQHHLALHPYHLRDLNNSVKDILNEELLKYTPGLGGIMCGYKNITFLSQLGRIIEDSCFIHVDIEADFFIFKPIVDKLLTGVVKKRSKDHVGCLVHNTFNVSLPKPKHAAEWYGHSTELDSKVEFVITYTNFDGTLPYIRGEIVDVLTKSVKTKRKKIKFEETASDIEDLLTAATDEVKKKKKKRKVFKEECADDENNGLEEISHLIDETSAKKKKGKKHKIEDDETHQQLSKKKKRLSE